MDQDGAGETAGSPQPGPPAAGTLKRIGQRLEWLGFWLVAALFGALPLDKASALSGWIWRTVAPRLRRHGRADRNLAASLPELSEAERETILLSMWESLGRTFAEAFHLGDIASDPSRIAIVLPQDVQDAVAGGRGCVLASLHLGNWEIATMAAMRVGFRPAGVYQRIKNPHVDADVTRLRAPYYPAGLFTKGHNTALKLTRHLRAGGTLAVMSDLRDVRGVSVPFFGRPAPSTPFPVLLARSQAVPLVAGRVVRLDGARFRVDTELVPVPRTGDRDTDIATGTAALHAVFERWIRDTPGQWMWAHRRWG